MLTKTESLCKWSLFGLLIISLFLPIYVIVKTDILYTTYVFDALFFFILLGTSVQAIPGLIGWFMLHRYDERGKKVIFGTYAVTLGLYGIYCLFLSVTLLFPSRFYIYPMEIVSMFAIVHFNAAVFVLQRFWTRDII